MGSPGREILFRRPERRYPEGSAADLITPGIPVRGIAVARKIRHHISAGHETGHAAHQFALTTIADPATVWTALTDGDLTAAT